MNRINLGHARPIYFPYGLVSPGPESMRTHRKESDGHRLLLTRHNTSDAMSVTVVSGEPFCTHRSFKARKKGRDGGEAPAPAGAQEPGYSIGDWEMQDDLTRAQRYRALAAQMWEAAEGESDPTRRRELLSLADQYECLANKLIGKGEAIRSRAGMPQQPQT
jgi:hypothetical protein